MNTAPIDSLNIPEWGWHYANAIEDQKLEMSLARYGQLSPIITYEDAEGTVYVLDGRRRLAALRRLSVQGGPTVVYTTHLGRLSEVEAKERTLTLDMHADINYIAAAKQVQWMQEHGVRLDELANYIKFTWEQMRYFLRLCDVNWSHYEVMASESLFEDEGDRAPITLEELREVEEEIPVVEEPQVTIAPKVKEPKEPKAPKEIKPKAPRIERLTKSAPAPGLSAARRLAQTMTFDHAPTISISVVADESGAVAVANEQVETVAAPKPMKLVQASPVALQAPRMPAYVQFAGHAKPVSTWLPSEPPSLSGIDELSLDTEGTGVKWWQGDRPIGISLHWGGLGRMGRRQYLPWAHAGGNLDEATVKRWAQRELRNKRLRGANIRYDVHMMRAWGVDLEAQGCTFTDVQHQAALLDEYRREFNLGSLMRDYLKHLNLSKVDAELDKSRMASYHAGDVAEYAEVDAEGVTELDRVFRPLLMAEDLMAVKDLEDQVIHVVLEMEKNGALIDRAALFSAREKSKELLDSLLWHLSRELGFAMNPDKNDDWVRLFKKYGIEITSYTETGAPSFTDAVLALIDHPAVQQARRAGKIASLRSKFLEAYCEVLGDDDILRFALHQLRGDEYGTIRGRFSMSGQDKGGIRFGANLQQVFSVGRQREAFGIDDKDSSHDDELFIVRKFFVPDRRTRPSARYVSADAQSIEYRLAAHYARSKQLIEAYQSDWDKINNPEKQDGKWVDFHNTVQQIIEPHKHVSRKTTKNLNFLKIYGGGRDKAAATLGLPRSESDQIIDLYDSMFPEFAALLGNTSQLARDRGWVKTLLGRRARFPNKEFTHAALNYVIQGSAADIMKTKLVELHKEREYTGLLMRQTVHDEVDGDAQLDETPERVKEVLNRQSFKTRVPIVWQVTVGDTWADC